MKANRGLDSQVHFYNLSQTKVRRYRSNYLKNGFALFESPAIEPSFFLKMRDEAREERKKAWLCDSSSSHKLSTRQRNHRAEVGEYANNFFSSIANQEVISWIVGRKVLPSFSASCFTYYDSVGDFLGVHTDRDGICALTLLLYFEVKSGPVSGPGIGLNLYKNISDDFEYPHFIFTPCSNSVCILNGSQIPHGRKELLPNESVSLLSVCYSFG